MSEATTAVPVKIAVNVMRARLTVLGFNNAIASFLWVRLSSMPGGIHSSGFVYPVHVGAQSALFIAIALSILAIVLFINSCAINQQGYSDHWSFLVADLLMYLALAHTVSGFFGPLESSIQLFALTLPQGAANIGVLHSALLIVGGCTWFTCVYLGPYISLRRSPFARAINYRLALGYVLLLASIFWISAHTWVIDQAGTLTVGVYLLQFVQPLGW